MFLELFFSRQYFYGCPQRNQYKKRHIETVSENILTQKKTSIITLPIIHILEESVDKKVHIFLYMPNIYLSLSIHHIYLSIYLSISV